MQLFLSKRRSFTFDSADSVSALVLFPWTRNFTPHCLSPPRCINGYRRHNSAGDNPAKDYCSIPSSGTETGISSGHVGLFGSCATLRLPWTQCISRIKTSSGGQSLILETIFQFYSRLLYKYDNWLAFDRSRRIMRITHRVFCYCRLSVHILPF